MKNPQCKYSLEDLLFPVALCDIWVEIPAKACVKPARFKAVTALDRKYVFAVVAEDYQLITNKEAIELGRECFQSVFSLLHGSDMELFNIVTPTTRSFCHIDYTHRQSEFNPFGGDTWIPYIRITNSYNRMFALNFDLGFCRRICWNGIIFGRKNIVFKFNHSKRAGEPSAKFRLRAGEFRDLEIQFVESLENLKRFYVPRNVTWALTCKVFGLPKLPDLPSPKPREIWDERRKHIHQLTKRYFTEIGDNGYAAFNVLTDFATRPVGYISADIQINALQQKAGDWIQPFITAVQSRDFSFTRYLGEYADLVLDQRSFFR